ncbi:bacteriocin [Cellulosilyticum ruminicola]|nr:bacteriocin [Cellulosilyticum ruminicola]
MKFEEVSQETLQNIDGGRILIDVGKIMTLSFW